MRQKPHIILLLLLFSSLVYSQEFPDYLVDENGFQFSCEIREIKNGRIKYYINGSSSIITKRIVEFKNGHLSDSSKVRNSLGTKIQKPDLGFANVYIYNGQTTAFKVYYNGEELVKIKGNSYFLLKIKSNELHTFYSSGDGSIVEIKAEEGNTYYVKGKLGAKMKSNGINDYAEYSHNLILENSELSRYAVLSMKKKTEK